jgi:hypothetical protein
MSIKRLDKRFGTIAIEKRFKYLFIGAAVIAIFSLTTAGCREIWPAFKKDAKEAGSSLKKESKEFGQTVKEDTKEAGQAIKEAVEEIKKK